LSILKAAYTLPLMLFNGFHTGSQVKIPVDVVLNVHNVAVLVISFGCSRMVFLSVGVVTP